MSYLEETRNMDIYQKMIFMDHIPLIPVEDQDAEDNDHETWLYALDSCLQNATFVHNLDDLPLLNTTMTHKETSHWLESTIQLHTEEIRLRETEPLTAAEIAAEEQRKLIDTRTFTRPRKRASPMRPVLASAAIEVPANLNSTFSRKTVSASGNGCNDILNATVVFDDAHTQLSQVELNTTFQIENGSPSCEAFSSPDNNNVYHLNTTFPSQMQSNRNSLGSTVINKCALNTTFSSEAEPHLDSPTLTFDYDIDDEDQLEEEAVFRKPLLPGAVPKRGLIRTSTLNNEATSLTPSKKDRSPVRGFGLKDIERAARLQEESLAQTSTPMGQRNSAAFRRPAEIDQNLGSPISSLSDQDSVLSATDGDPSSGKPASDTKKARGQLTFEKSQNSLDTQSNSPSSPGDSPYSSQSLESDTAGTLTREELLRRSMPNLNNPATRGRLPHPSVGLASNLNRLHGSDSGLRPPSIQAGHVPVGTPVNGSQPRPQLRPPQTSLHREAAGSPSLSMTSGSSGLSDFKKPLQRLSGVGLQPPARNSLPPPNMSKLKPPQLVTPRMSMPRPVNLITNTTTGSSARPADDLNATKVVDKTTVVASTAVGSNSSSEMRPSSGIPRPQMSKIPAPRPKSSIPTMAFRPRAPQ